MAKLPSPADLAGGRPNILATGSVSAAKMDTPPRLGAEAEGTAALGKSLAGLGQDIATVFNREREHAQQAQVEDAFNQLRTQQLDLTLGQENGFTNVKGGDAVKGDLLKNWGARFDEKAAQIEQSLPDDRARERFRARAGIAKASFQGDIMQHVSHQADVYSRGVLASTIDTETRSAGAAPTDPTAFGIAVERLNAAIDSEGRRVGKDADQIKADKAKALDHLWNARLEAWRLVDPAGAMKAYQDNAQYMGPDMRLKLGESLFRDAAPVLATQWNAEGGSKMSDADLLKMTSAEAVKVKTGNEVIDRLPADQKLYVLQLARTQAHQQMALLRDGLRQRVMDTTAAYERGLDAPNAPSRSELVAAFGPEDGGKIVRELAVSRQFGKDVLSLSSLPASQQAELLKRREPQPGEGFANAVHRQEQLQRAAEVVQKQREQDPALATLQTSAQVKSAYEAYANAQGPDRVSAAQAYAAASLAEQLRLEIRNPQVLTKDQVDTIGRQFAAPLPQGQSLGNVMRGMTEQWGRYWPLVGKQLAKTLPPDAFVIGLGVKPEAEEILSDVARMKPEALKQGIPEADIKTIQERVRTELDGLRRSVVWQEGGIQTYDNYADSAERVATALVQKGLKMKDAATKAVESTVGFKYEFEDTWRVPKTELGGATSMSALRSGADAIKLDVASEKPVAGEKVELLVPYAGPAVRPKDAERQWRDTIASNGFWVTSPGDKGLTLYVRSGLSAQPVLDDRGLPVVRTWQQVSDIGNSVRAATFKDVYKKGVRTP